MNKDTLAALLNGREYGSEITQAEEALARAAGLVAVMGYSDDNMELRGVFSDELSCYGTTKFILDHEGVLPKWEDVEDDEEEAEKFLARKKNNFATITAIWDRDGYSWTYETKIPHATFEIMEDGEKYCRGIVFEVSQLK